MLEIVTLLMSFSLINSSIPVVSATFANSNYNPKKSSSASLVSSESFSTGSFGYYVAYAAPKKAAYDYQKEQERLAEEKRQREEAEKLRQEAEAAAQRQREFLASQQRVAYAAATPRHVQPSHARPAAVKRAPAANYSGDMGSYISSQCASYGCSSDQLMRVMQCESGGRSNATNGIYTGLFQFHPNTFAANAGRAGVAGADIWNPQHQAQVAAYMFANGQARQWSCK